LSKLRPLLNAGAFVTVVASEIRDELNIPGVFPIKREFILSDLGSSSRPIQEMSIAWWRSPPKSAACS